MKPAWNERETRGDVSPEQGGSGAQSYLALLALAVVALLGLGFCLSAFFLARKNF